MPFKLEIKNFQSIEYADLEIKELTAITGTNNAGKSALVRAFFGTFTNAPAKTLVRKGADNLEVKVSFEDGNVIWKKGKLANDYIINGDEKTNVNRGPPEDIVDLKVLPVEVSGSQKKSFWPQIARQSDNVAFVLNELGTTVAEVVVSDVEKVAYLNQALSMSERLKREARAEEKIRKKDRDEVQIAINSYSSIRGISKNISTVLKDLGILRKKIDLYKRLSQLEVKTLKVKEELKSLENLNFFVPHVTDLLSTHDTLVKVARLYQRFKRLREEKKSFSHLTQNKVPEVIINIELILRLKNLERKIKDSQTKIQEVQELGFKIKKLVEDNNGKIQEYLGGMETCPTCGSSTIGDLL